MTFVVNLNGVTSQKDLGAQTADQAKGITAINPDKTWRPRDPGDGRESGEPVEQWLNLVAGGRWLEKTEASRGARPFC